jgi:hypothetical protein
MKSAALILAFYVLLLSLLPAMATNSKAASTKMSCMQCCQKKAPSMPKKQAADNELSNPFFDCSTCVSVLISEFSFQVKRLSAMFVEHAGEACKLYYVPLFDFWHPPRMIVQST